MKSTPFERDAAWVLSFGAGTPWGDGTISERGTASGFRPNRERELIDAGVLVPTDEPGKFTVGEKKGNA